MTLDLARPVPAETSVPLGPCPVMETSRMILRPHRLSDARAIALSLGDFSVSRMLARVPQPYHLADARDWLESEAGASGWQFAITENGVDHIGVVSIERRRGAWHLGYWLSRPAWGRGMMTEAARGVLDLFFRRMPDETVTSGVFADNAASLRVQSKLGFAVTGVADVFVPARSASVTLIETRLTQDAFRSAG